MTLSKHFEIQALIFWGSSSDRPHSNTNGCTKPLAWFNTQIIISIRVGRLRRPTSEKRLLLAIGLLMRVIKTTVLRIVRSLLAHIISSTVGFKNPSKTLTPWRLTFKTFSKCWMMCCCSNAFNYNLETPIKWSTNHLPTTLASQQSSNFCLYHHQ